MKQQAVVANGVGPVPHHVAKEVAKAKKQVAKKNQKPVVKASATIIPPAPAKRRGRAPGSKNKPKAVATAVGVGPRAPITVAGAPEEFDITNLIPNKAVGDVIEVLEQGALKYQGREWSARPNDHVAKAMGHLASSLAGSRYDQDTGLNPLAHAAARLILALQIELEKK